MLSRLASAAIRFPRSVLVGTLIVMIAAGVYGVSVSKYLSGGGFTTSNAESTRAAQLMSDKLKAGGANLILLVTADDGIDSPAAKARAVDIVDQLKKSADVSSVQSYWTDPAAASGLRADDGSSALISARIGGDDRNGPRTAAALVKPITGTKDGVTVRAGGIVASDELNHRIGKDLFIAEMIAVPITAVLLLLVFGSFVAMWLPLIIGVFSIFSTMAILRLMSEVTDVSTYALNMTTGMGLALGIDYSLFIVSRYREELTNGLSERAAVIRSIETAGRTVLFSAVTVALGLASLLVFPVYFLKSFAYAGLAVVAAAALASMLVLPAALILLGQWVNRLDVRAPFRKMLGKPEHPVFVPEKSLWYKTVNFVTRFALPIAVVVIGLLLVIGSPFLSARFGSPDDRALPPSSTARQVGDVLRDKYSHGASGSVSAVLPSYTGDSTAIGAYAAELSRVKGVTEVKSIDGTYVDGTREVTQVLPPAGTGAPIPPQQAPGGARPKTDGTYLSIATSYDPYSSDASEQLDALRDVKAPSTVLFGGQAASNQDVITALTGKLPLAIALIATSTFILLFLFTGSIALPIKAIVLNTLSLTAAFGAMVWIFQDGHGASLLDLTVTGYLVPTMTILMFCLSFGMSMDYEVFVLSRVREEWIKSHRTAADNTHALAMGLARTGRIITAAAALMAVVFFTMVTSKVSFIQLFGLGMTLTVLVDATIIRGILVPALMRLMGRFNWWAPKPLTWLHDRIGLTEETPPAIHREAAKPPAEEVSEEATASEDAEDSTSSEESKTSENDKASADA
ncbi:MMPL family transporter [Smaragdicoccus niigatensis]|uniref:MMPL family transporter n=1 Tax=Smaragdicoccus niigatensis TaxID=359359 RepID=UPI0012DE2270|nr:MMPL family transporter [Smaragdicoccus niigatensis]